jgi:uncharacterized coiled-coil protein SlyX
LGTRYKAKYIKELNKEVNDIVHFIEKNEDKMEDNFEKMLGFDEEDVEKWAMSENGGMKYFKEL